MNKLIASCMLLPLLSLAKGGGFDETVNAWFKPVSDLANNIILYRIFDIPVILIVLVSGAAIFMIYLSFVNITKIPLAFKVVRGKYDDIENEDTVDENSGKTKKSSGEISHFQALCAAVSGTVGLGNIAGVAMAVSIGGPGATLWMVVCAFFGMCLKFVECTLGVKYRDVSPDGTIYGGPMYYMSKGFKEINREKLGKVVAVIFSILCIGASFGGGNAAQSNQVTNQLKSMLELESGSSGVVIGAILALVVGLVIIGGIKRIATVTERIVPLMAVTYILACLIIIFRHVSNLGDVFVQIFDGAFSPEAGLGGVLGVIVIGFQRGAFSNESGAGSAAIAHSAVKTNYPASEGIVALIEPFIDTIIICTMTALVIIIYNQSGVFQYGGGGAIVDGVKVEGAALTSMAFADTLSWFPYVLTVAIVLFAISTMITWSYYGVQSWMYIFGKSKSMEITYKIIFLVFIIAGAASSMDAVWGFSDAMILGMVFPNMFAMLFLFPKVKIELNKYLNKIKSVGKR